MRNGQQQTVSFFSRLFATVTRHDIHEAPGQTPHDMSSTGLYIDGRKHPELIADMRAYHLFMYFVATAAEDSSSLPVAKAILLNAGVNPDEVNTILSLLLKFKKQHDADIAEFNHLASENDAAGIPTDPHPFWAKRDALVVQTRNLLASSIRANSILNLHSFVQAEKARMRVAVEQ